MLGAGKASKEETKKADVHHHSPAATAATTKKESPDDLILYNLYLQTIWFYSCGKQELKYAVRVASVVQGLHCPLHSLSAAAV